MIMAVVLNREAQRFISTVFCGKRCGNPPLPHFKVAASEQLQQIAHACGAPGISLQSTL